MTTPPRPCCAARIICAPSRNTPFRATPPHLLHSTGTPESGGPAPLLDDIPRNIVSEAAASAPKDAAAPLAAPEAATPQQSVDATEGDGTAGQSRTALADPTAADPTSAPSAARAPFACSASETETAVQRIGPVWEAPFLEALTRHGTVEGACRMVGIYRQRAYEHRTTCPAFAAAWKDAQERHADLLEEELFRRGREGWDEPVFFAGECIGTKRRYSDACLIAALKAARPSKYRDGVDLSQISPLGPLVRVRTPQEAAEQLAPYADAALMLLRSLADAENIKRGALPALPAPAEAQPQDQATTAPLSTRPETQHGAKKCPRCTPLIVPSPYCPICHGKPIP